MVRQSLLPLFVGAVFAVERSPTGKHVRSDSRGQLQSYAIQPSAQFFQSPAVHTSGVAKNLGAMASKTSYKCKDVRIGATYHELCTTGECESAAVDNTYTECGIPTDGSGDPPEDGVLCTPKCKAAVDSCATDVQLDCGSEADDSGAPKTVECSLMEKINKLCPALHQSAEALTSPTASTDVGTTYSGDAAASTAASTQTGYSAEAAGHIKPTTVNQAEAELKKIDKVVAGAEAQAGVADTTKTSPAPSSDDDSAEETTLAIVAICLVVVCCGWSIAWGVVYSRMTGKPKSTPLLAEEDTAEPEESNAEEDQEAQEAVEA